MGKNIKSTFKDLFVLDMANNHQGFVEHGQKIIQQHSAVVQKHGIKAAMKFQYRDLPNFIHPEHQKKSDNKHVPRFLSTKLTWEQFDVLRTYAADQGFLTMCTPFDEVSVAKIQSQGFDILKIASCSVTDWPLLEAAASTGLPMIVSTGGVAYQDVDKVVSFLNNRGVDFALMHCVSIYPTASHQCNLNNITALKTRFRDLHIGWSTHEDPNALLPIAAATSLGAEMFERHVGVADKEIALNSYSSTPDQIDRWIGAYLDTKSMLGSHDRVYDKNEQGSLLGLKRGVILTRSIKAEHKLEKADVEFVFPCNPGQLSSGEFKAGMVCQDNLKAGTNIHTEHVLYEETIIQVRERCLKEGIHEVKALLNLADIRLYPNFDVEYSHHYGLENFRETGAVLITIINKEYAKKLVVQLSGQSHPLHMHKLKDETFIVLHGDLNLRLGDEEFKLQKGDQMTVPPGVWHSFSSENGCIFEEISTTASKGDSYYRDPVISAKSNSERKTAVNHWNGYNLTRKISEAG